MRAFTYTAFCFLLFTAGTAFSQDAGMSDVETVEDSRMEGDKVVFLPGENRVRYVPRTTSVYAPADSVALQIHDFPMQQAAQRTIEKSQDKQDAAKKDDSILTFNFLYYIIQKYKLQDIID